MRHFFMALLATLVCLASPFSTKAVTGKLYTSDLMSNNLVTSLAQDSKGYIWIGTAYGLNRYDGYRLTAYIHDAADEHSLGDNNVTALFCDSRGLLWIGSANGLFTFSKDCDNFDRIPLTCDSLSRPRITSFAESKSGDVYIGTEGFGLYIVKKGTTQAVRTNAFDDGDKGGFYSYIHIDKKGRLWTANNDNLVRCFAIDGGKTKPMLRLKSEQGAVIQITDSPDGGVAIVSRNGITLSNGQQTNTISNVGTEHFNCACRSANKDLILGTDGNGIFTLNASHQLKITKLPNDHIDLATVNTTALLEDRGGNLWIGCAERGLAFVPAMKAQFQAVSLTQLGIKTSSVIKAICHETPHTNYVAVGGAGLYKVEYPSYNVVRLNDAPATTDAIHRDSEGRIWLAANKRIYSFNKATGTATPKWAFDCIYLRTLTDDGHGNLIVSVFGKGLSMINADTGQRTDFSMFQTDDARRGHLCNDWVLQLMRSRNGMVWIGTSSGVQCFDPRTQSFKPYGWHNILDGKAANSFAEDRDGNIIIGTIDGLYLYNIKNKKTERFPHSEKLRNLRISYIVCLANGDLWCSTTMGIWHYDKAKGQFSAYMNGNGLSSHEYIEGIGMATPENRIVFATPEGMTVFHPNDVTQSHYVALKPTLTEIVVGGKTVNTNSRSDGSPIVEGDVSETDRMELSYADNTFTLEFSTFDYANSDNVQLEYHLDNDRWTTNKEGNNAVSFAHLPAGTYKLYVRTNNHGQLSPESVYTIVVRAPWYRSTLAYIFYVIVIVAIGFVGVNVYQKRKRRELDEEKMQFLINATHDIRTPLTLILNPLHQLMKQSETDAPEDMDKLQTINHNANRILTLVNQILDIRKMDKMQMHLRCKETSLVKLIDDICKTFNYNAEKRNINFTFNHPKDVTAWVDRTQFDKVVTNLLSNAFKYTADGGEISVSLKADEQNAIIEVADNGTGLKDDELERIFKRFYQSNNRTAVEGEGTGIGLNLCKMIVDMHHGNISAHNRTNVQGSLFRVTIPLGNAHLKAEEIDLSDEPAKLSKHPGTSYRVMLVDDDPEITEYISNQLSQHYRFTVCRNGKQAIGELLSNKYDIVVSDVMMPEMDGFTLLRLIKTNSNISHIPVILLTTEAAIGNRLEGLEKGADAFLAKPFMLDELKATIDNLIANRLKLKGKFSGAQQQADKVEAKDIEDNDKELMDRIMKSINKNIGDSDFNVEMLCQDICVSRTQLHRKMKELTGLSTAEFIRNIRLEQAARLLKERQVNVSQVAYTLGFTNTAHFSKVFKQHFGVPPSEYGKRE